MAAAEATGGVASPRIGPAVLDALVVGAGQAGLAAGYHLKRAGLSFEILEAEGSPAARGRATTTASSSFRPRATRACRACHSRAPPTATLPATRSWATCAATPRPSGFPCSRASASCARSAPAVGSAADRRRRGVPGRTLIAATGSFARPHQPRFPGQEAFRGKILHAAEYRNPIPFRGSAS